MRAARVAAGTLLALVAFGCAGGDRDAKLEVIATLDGRSLSLSDLERSVAEAVGRPVAAVESEVLRRLFTELLAEELLFAAALDEGLVDPDAGRAEGARALFESQVAAVSEAEVRAHYIAHPSEFEVPERLRLSQLLSAERRSAAAAAERLAAGELAERVAASAGALGVESVELAVDELPAGFAEVLAELAPGESSGVLGEGYQLHVFRLEERLPAGIEPFEAVRDRIARRLAEERGAATRSRLLAESARRYNVEIAVERLPFTLDAPALLESLSRGDPP